MNAHNVHRRVPLACTLMLGLLLAACERPVPPGDTPAPVEPPEPEAAVPVEAAAMPAPAGSVAAPASTAPEVAAVAVEPELARMTLAQADGKIGVPVDLRYQFDGDPMTGQAVALHLAVVPRVAGSNLSVSIKQEEGIHAKASAMSVQKAGAATPYRQQLVVTRQSASAEQLRVLVTMDLPEGSAFGYFSVPFRGSAQQ